jgi:ATPase subunit of ABC transporter with duplicated ATPase domains
LDYLFEEVTFRLGAGDRVGLVGKNGAGKSTMLKMLAGDFSPDTGVISQEKKFVWDFYVKILILSKEEQFWKLMSFCRYKNSRKKIRRNQSSISYSY